MILSTAAALVSVVAGPALASIGATTRGGGKRKDDDGDAPSPSSTPSPTKKTRTKLKGVPVPLDGPLADEIRNIFRLGCTGQVGGINPSPGMWNIDDWETRHPRFKFHDPEYYNKNTILQKLKGFAAGIMAEFNRAQRKGGNAMADWAPANPEAAAIAAGVGQHDTTNRSAGVAPAAAAAPAAASAKPSSNPRPVKAATNSTGGTQDEGGVPPDAPDSPLAQAGASPTARLVATISKMSVRNLLGGGIVNDCAAALKAAVAEYNRRRQGQDDGSDQTEPISFPTRMTMTKIDGKVELKIHLWLYSGTQAEDYSVIVSQPGPDPASPQQTLTVCLNTAGPFEDPEILTESHRTDSTKHPNDGTRLGNSAVYDISNGGRDIQQTFDRINKNKWATVISLPAEYKFKTNLVTIKTTNKVGTVEIDNPDFFHVNHKLVNEDEVAPDDIDFATTVGTHHVMLVVLEEDAGQATPRQGKFKKTSVHKVTKTPSRASRGGVASNFRSPTQSSPSPSETMS